MINDVSVRLCFTVRGHQCTRRRDFSDLPKLQMQCKFIVWSRVVHCSSENQKKKQLVCVCLWHASLASTRAPEASLTSMPLYKHYYSVLAQLA